MSYDDSKAKRVAIIVVIASLALLGWLVFGI
jgi:hypothetical protein